MVGVALIRLGGDAVAMSLLPPKTAEANDPGAESSDDGCPFRHEGKVASPKDVSFGLLVWHGRSNLLGIAGFGR